jgi:hypothetical protein
MDRDIGERLARGLAEKDRRGLLDLLAPAVDFRAMTPSKFWESNTATEVVDDIFFGPWFGDNDRIEALDAFETDTVVDRERVGYRLRVVNDAGTFAVDQQAYYSVEDGRIAWLRIMCAGYRRVQAAAPAAAQAQA